MNRTLLRNKITEELTALMLQDDLCEASTPEQIATFLKRKSDEIEATIDLMIANEDSDPEDYLDNFFEDFE
jgi:hypothetical protein